MRSPVWKDSLKSVQRTARAPKLFFRTFVGAGLASRDCCKLALDIHASSTSKNQRHPKVAVRESDAGFRQHIAVYQSEGRKARCDELERSRSERTVEVIRAAVW